MANITSNVEGSPSSSLNLPSDRSGLFPAAYKLALANRLSVAQLGDLMMTSPTPLFVYGSLQLPNILISKLDEADGMSEAEIAQKMTPAKLYKHKIFAQHDTIYPAILDTEDPEDVVQGMVIFGLTESQRQALDRYEAGYYSREEVTANIQMASGDHLAITAWTYIWARSRTILIDPSIRQWTIQGFLMDLVLQAVASTDNDGPPSDAHPPSIEAPLPIQAPPSESPQPPSSSDNPTATSNSTARSDAL